MSFRSGMIFALGAGLLLGGCAAGPAGVSGPVTSPTGHVYELGTPPRDTRLSGTVTLLIAQGQYDRALEQAQEGIAAEPDNARYYFLAGQAHLGLGNVAEGLQMFDRAEELYPAYELETEVAREEAWAVAFTEGIEAYNENDLEAAAAAWERANTIFQLRSESFLNLAVVYTQQADYDRAIAAYRAGLEALDRVPASRVLSEEEVAEREENRIAMMTNLAQLLNFTEQYSEAEQLYRRQLEIDPNDIDAQSNLAVALARQGRTAEAQEIYNRLLSDTGLAAADLFNVGVALFQGENFAQSAEAFRRFTEMLPNSRDGWYNYANALYAENRWEPLVQVGAQLVRVDPLNENSALILARAYREQGQNQQALRTLQAIETRPIHIETLEFRPSSTGATVFGRASNAAAAPGTAVQLRFTFFDEAGTVVGTQTVSVSAPAEGATTTFEATYEGETPAITYGYELVS